MKLKTMFAVVLIILSAGLFLAGCNHENTDKNNNPGKILILQAYGNGPMDGNSPGGVSHSFVELYNPNDKAINLDGYGLYYADGTSTSTPDNTATKDGEWKRISLNGKTIPAGASLLILGKKHTSTSSTRYIIPDNYGDINNDNFILSRRAFKVALIRSTEPLTVQNPFNVNGKKVSGYIDMVGAANEYSKNGDARDRINGFEYEPARNSASEAVRRVDIKDFDDNYGDFESIRYASDGISDELLKVRKPRNSIAGKWNPFAEPGTDPPLDGPFVEAGTQDTLAGKLLILQVYGSSSDAAGISHSFVELYNTTESAINLSGITLYYADGTSVGSGLTNTATKDEQWNKIALTSSIPAGTSYLILGPKQSSSGRYQIPESSGDINNNNFTLSNRAFKVALIRNTATLTAQNPFNMGSGAKAAGYIDMVGSANEYQGRDLIFGFETAPARNSASVAARRKNLSDSNNNANDFSALDYRVWSASNPDRMTAEVLEVKKPRNSGAGKWNPFAEPLPPPEGTERLMILQANTFGNDNGGFPKSLVELYNNSNVDINLNTGNYYLHIGSTGTPGWTHAIKLTGTVPARSSYLIVTTDTTEVNSATQTHAPPLVLPVADQIADFKINNTNFKVAVLKNQSSVLTVANPFTAGLGANYVDMLGTGSATGFEGATASSSKPQIARRKSLADTDKNNEDFVQYDTRSANWATNAPNIFKFWPRNSAAGPWNPITGASYE